MIISKRKPISGDEPPAVTMMVLPNELLIDILTLLLGKHIGRCKCVCKLWRLIIGSRPFSETYRKRQRGLLLYWSEFIKQRKDGLYAHRLHFFHCPLRRLGEPLGEFSPLRELEFGTDGEPLTLRGVTKFVYGLLCVGERDGWGSNLRLTLHNICTGEKMRIPDPLPCVHTRSTYHLGYDSARRIYKLLRLIFRVSDDSLQGAHIMNLSPPSDSLSTWRELDYNAAGICNMHFVRRYHLSEERTSPDDGMLCWIHICLSPERQLTQWFCSSDKHTCSVVLLQ